MNTDDFLIFHDKLSELTFDDLSILKSIIQSLLNKKFKELNTLNKLEGLNDK